MIFHRIFLALPLLLALPACNTTASRALVASIQNYDARSREAIDAVATIERRAVEMPAPSASDAEKDFVTAILDPRLKLDGTATDAQGRPVDLVRLVARRVHPTDIPAVAEAPALLEMRCAHGRFTQALSQVELAGIFGKKPVARRAPEFLDILIAQQVAMAKIVQGPAHASLLGQKTALIAKIEQIRRGSGSNDEKGAALIAARTEWLALDAEEERLTADAVSQLLKAAATGLDLRGQLVAYGKLSLSDIADSAKGLTGFIAATSGRDLAALDGRVDEVRLKIEGDPDFDRTAKALLARVDLPALPTVALGASGGAPAPAPAGSSTPCLDRQRQAAVPPA